MSRRKAAKRTAHRERTSAGPEEEMQHEDVPAMTEDVNAELDENVEKEYGDM